MDTKTLNSSETMHTYTKRYEDIRLQVLKYNETMPQKVCDFSILLRKGVMGWLRFWEQNLPRLKVAQSTIQEYCISEEIKPRSLDISMIVSNIIIYLSEKEG